MNRGMLAIATLSLITIVVGASLLIDRLSSADRAMALAERQRLALWRLDAYLTGLVLGEASRSPDAYRDGRLSRLPAAPWLVHVERHEDGRVTSPQSGEVDGMLRMAVIDPVALGTAIPWSVPVGAATATPVGHGQDPPTIVQSQVLFAQAEAAESSLDVGDYEQRSRSLKTAKRQMLQVQNALPPPESPSTIAQLPIASGFAPGSAPAPVTAEDARAGSFSREPMSGASLGVVPGTVRVIVSPAVPVVARQSSEPEIGIATVVWVGEHLALLRAVRIAGQISIQAAVFDQPALLRELRSQIADLLPNAELRPASSGSALALAAAPLHLVPGEVELALSSTARETIALALIAVLVGVTLSVVVLVALMRLSERRAAFVSAVTHELRTPLTSLCLHADLLADERIGGDHTKRAERIGILREETGRLTHLIDNVLDYARLERRPPRLRDLTLPELLDPLLPSFAERLRAVGLSLEHDPVPLVQTRCDPAAVERILRNLVDNAAKYAANGMPPAVHLRIRVTAHQVELQVRDFGPGIAVDARRRIFTPFFRSAEAAAGHAPGVGLGLALCRRLALAHGGDLRIDTPLDGPGLLVRLRLPRAHAAPS